MDNPTCRQTVDAFVGPLGSSVCQVAIAHEIHFITAALEIGLEASDDVGSCRSCC